MNYLAHIFLSGNDSDLVIGNFIGDHVKGKSIELLPIPIRNGVLLHRNIDSFTDQHPVVHQTILRLRPKFRKYAPVISDIFYDHFLAANWNRYHALPLSSFASNFYRLAETYLPVLPTRSVRVLHFMEKHNWLVKYESLEGLNEILNGMAHRAAFESGMEHAAAELQEQYLDYKKDFEIFFGDLQAYVDWYIKRLHANVSQG